MIPFAATMIPLFRLFAQLGMVNSTFAVIVPLIATPFLILLFRQASRSFPHEIIEAARLDGLGEVSIFARIYLPTMKPTLAAAGVITFLFSWNNFLWPKVILVDNAYQTLPMLLSNMRAGYVTDYGSLMLAVFIVSVPTMVVFLAAAAQLCRGRHGSHQVTFDLSRIADPEYVQENRLDPHSDHRWFASAQEAATGTSSFEQSLNGLWKLHYAKSPALVVPGFERVDVDDSGWDDVPVPAHVQLLGYDRPQYTNVQYPWDGYEQLEPGQVPQRYNPVATYRRTFTLEHPLEPGERLSVSFHGAESAVALWLNGTYVGYGTDSFTPSEFDLTDALVDGENLIVAQVVRWSAGSWIEDQDFFRFSGLFRDVVLYRRPAVHVEDVRVVTDVADDLSEATVRVRVVLAGDGQRGRPDRRCRTARPATTSSWSASRARGCGARRTLTCTTSRSTCTTRRAA